MIEAKKNAEIEALAHKINSFGACDTKAALFAYQEYITRSLDADAVIWCALYRGPYGKSVWQTQVMDDWKVFDLQFPEGVEIDIDKVKSDFYAKARKEGGLGEGIRHAMSSAGLTRAHLIEDAMSLSEWKQHWEYKLLLRQGMAERMVGAYNLSDVSESHVWVDRALGKPKFRQKDKQTLIDCMNRFPRFHRWLMLERGLLHPASRPLSPREREVLHLLFGPSSEVQIAEKMELAQGTIHNYIIGIYKVFDVRGRYQLMQLWLD